MKRNDLVIHSRSRKFKKDNVLVLGKVSHEKDNNIYGRLIEISNIENKKYHYYKFFISRLGRKDKFRTLYSNELFWTGLNIMGEELKKAKFK